MNKKGNPNFTEGNKEGKKFSSENQPSSENKSAGQQKAKNEKERLETLKEIGQFILKNPVNKEKEDYVLSKFPDFKDKKIDTKVVLFLNTLGRMSYTEVREYEDKKGNKHKITKKMSDKDYIKYMEFIRDTIGEKPSEKFEGLENGLVKIIVESEKDKKAIENI